MSLSYQEKMELRAEIEDMRQRFNSGIEEIGRRNFHAKLAEGRSNLRKIVLDIRHDPEQMKQIAKDEQEFPGKSYQSIIEAHQSRYSRGLGQARDELAGKSMVARYIG